MMMIRIYRTHWINKIPLALAVALSMAACSGPVRQPSAIGATPAVTPHPSPAVQATIPLPVQAQPSQTPTSSAPASALGVQRAALHGLHIHYWYSGSLEYQRAIENLVNTYNASSPEGIWVETRYFGSFGGLMDELRAAPPDSRPEMALTYPALAAGWDSSGPQPVDLAPYLQDPTWGLSNADQQAFSINFSARGGTSLTSLPGYREESLLFYNQTWASELGFSGQLPGTPQDFQVQACAAAAANQKSKNASLAGTGGWITAATPDVVLSWIAAFGGQDPTGLEFSYQNPADQQAFAFLKGMFDAGCAWVSRLPDPAGYFAHRQALFFSGSQNDFSAVNAAMAAAKSSDRWTVLPYPGQDGKPVVYADGPDNYIFKSTPERQLAAWAFLRWLSQAVNQAGLAEAAGVLPARSLTEDQLTPGLKGNALWRAMRGMAGSARAMPAWPGWSEVGPMLGDAAGQLFQIYTKPDQVPSILDDLDKTIQEVSTHP